MGMTNIFVYGTLKRNHRRNFYLRDETFIGEIETTAQYRLYKAFLCDYPCMVESTGGQSIKGELWQVSDECLSRLDFLEKGFQRKTILLHNGESAQAYICAQKPLFSRNIGKEFM